MIALFISPLYFAGAWFLAHELMRILVALHPYTFSRWAVRLPVYVCAFIMSLLLPIGFLLGNCELKYDLLHVGNVFLGVEIYTVPIFLLNELTQLPFRRKHLPHMRRFVIISGGICAALAALVCMLGVANAKNIKYTDYEVSLSGYNMGKTLNIAMVSDLHIGYNIGTSMIADMVAKINATSPDLVVISGDIFDNDFDALDDPEQIKAQLQGIKSKYGTYACYGNHDIDEPILAGFTFNYDDEKKSDPRMDAFLEDCGITLLRDEGLVIDDSFYLYGRPDKTKPGGKSQSRLTANELSAAHREAVAEAFGNADASRSAEAFGNADALGSAGTTVSLPFVVIDHEPYEQAELAEAGVDLVLSGHTHAGQFFPVNLLTRNHYDNFYGYKTYGRLHDIVTSGVGLYGPFIRVGTDSEICRITLSY